MRILWILFYWCAFFISSIKAQDSSLDNYTGDWNNTGSWTSGTIPANNDMNEDLTINGYITLQTGVLEFSGGGGETLIINDTLVVVDPGTSRLRGGNTIIVNGLLVIMGNLNYNSGTTFTVNSGGIVAVAGNFGAFGGGDPNFGAGTVYVEGTSGYTDVSPADDLEGDGHGNIGDFLDGTSTTLPVEMKYFVATAAETSAALNWATSSELNNAGFEVEKSENAIDFHQIGYVGGYGTVNTEKTYAFTDHFFDGHTYYRLKQVDFDGAYEYSEVVEARHDLTGDLEISVFPNPAATSDNLNVFFNSIDADHVRVSLSTITGKLVLADLKSDRSGGGMQIALGNSGLSHGYYILELATDVKKYYRKVLIK